MVRIIIIIVGINYVRFCLVSGKCCVQDGKILLNVDVLILLRILKSRLINIGGVIMWDELCYYECVKFNIISVIYGG